MRKLIIALSLLLLVGCETPAAVEVPIIAPKPALNLQDPDPVTFSSYNWTANIDGQGNAIIGLTDAQFKQLLSDIGKTTKYIEQLNKEVHSYKQYYEPPDKSK